MAVTVNSELVPLAGIICLDEMQIKRMSAASLVARHGTDVPWHTAFPPGRANNR